MQAIQGSNWWVDSTVRFPDGGVGRNFLGGTLNNTGLLNQLDETADSLASVISDVEEEGEVPEPPEETHPHQTISDSLAEEIAAGQDELSASDELVSAIAKHLQIIEAAMRQHQATGASTFHDNSASDEHNPAEESFNGSLQGDMLQDPAAAFAATIPGINRLGLLSLLNG